MSICERIFVREMTQIKILRRGITKCFYNLQIRIYMQKFVRIMPICNDLSECLVDVDFYRSVNPWARSENASISSDHARRHSWHVARSRIKEVRFCGHRPRARWLLTIEVPGVIDRQVRGKLVVCILRCECTFE